MIKWQRFTKSTAHDEIRSCIKYNFSWKAHKIYRWMTEKRCWGYSIKRCVQVVNAWNAQMTGMIPMDVTVTARVVYLDKGKGNKAFSKIFFFKICFIDLTICKGGFPISVFCLSIGAAYPYYGWHCRLTAIFNSFPSLAVRILNDPNAGC